MSELPGTTALREEEISREVTATGPTASSLLLPNTAYTSTGRNAPYSPYTLGTPAMFALQRRRGREVSVSAGERAGAATLPLEALEDD